MLQIYVFFLPTKYTHVSVVSDSELTAREKVRAFALDKKHMHAPYYLTDEEIELSEVYPIVQDTVIWKEW